MKYNNDTLIRKNPIKRNSKFFDAEDFEMELNYMKEYIEEDANQTIILYQVDLNQTKVNDLYKESKKDNVRFKPPIELNVVYEIKDGELKTYDSQLMKGVYSKIGTLTFSVLIKTLEENNCDINRGDYIGVQINSQEREYWVVVDDGRVNSTSNKFSLYGTKPYARTIECAPVDKNEFNG